MAANALVGSHLDNCYSLCRSLSALGLHKLKCVQNILARIVTKTSKYSHINPVRKTLHWLPVEHCSLFNCLTGVQVPTLWLSPKKFSLSLDIVFITSDLTGYPNIQVPDH